METTAMPRTLEQLRPGQSANILRLRGDSSLQRRLAALGLLPQTSVQVLRVAPLGDPMTISVSGQQLSLRKVDARSIELTPQDSPQN